MYFKNFIFSKINLECPEGKYGAGCRGVCLCKNNATCDSFTGECDCTPGWRGQYCDKVCADGYFGSKCKQQCRCGANNKESLKLDDSTLIFSKCNPTTGECQCKAGWTGADCRTPCPQNRWGFGCDQQCKCQNGGICDPITGFCECTSGFMGKECEHGMILN